MNSEGNPDTSTDNTEVTPSTPQPATDPNSLFADQLANIKAEDGRQKFNDVETALSSIPHAQSYINELSTKVKQLEQELEQRKGIETVLERIDSLSTSQAKPVEQPSSSGIDPTQIEQLLDQRLAQRELAQRQQENANLVLNQLKERFGEKAEVEFNTKAQQLGLSPAQLSDLARSAPQAALAFFQAPPSNPANPTTGSVNSATFDNRPQSPDTSHMDLFTGAANEAIKKWREAGQF